MALRIATNVVMIWAIGIVWIWLRPPVAVSVVRTIGALLMAVPFAWLMDLRWLAQRRARLRREQVFKDDRRGS
ncbi:MAG: hypothetical protein J0I47_13225 [Sphingomonas sp.]|uniref:hypothetical protein n=1 Tax=Sphingomonas sp. TaxID=28214 RepID=UPI001AC5E0CD|nr:hypothetical protein [Sphingomonas sp.]MBN8809180.1 hypothetical protein [Sphingomonas sp.]